MWTRTLIGPEMLKKWVAKPYGKISFPLTQLFTEHGCFNGYLYRTYARASSLGYAHCIQPRDENKTEGYAEHILMRYEAFEYALRTPH